MKFLLLILLPCFCNSQVAVKKVKSGKIFLINKVGKIEEINNNTYNEQRSVRILNVSKYIDTVNIRYDFGGNVMTHFMANLREGVYPLNSMITGGPNSIEKKVLKIQLVKDTLVINCEINDFYGKNIARVVNNKLITVEQGIAVYASDRYFEIIDQYNFPVLQIELNKSTNSIYVGGAFNSETSFIIVSKEGINTNDLPMDKLLMSASDRDKWFYEFKKRAATLQKIHE